MGRAHRLLRGIDTCKGGRGRREIGWEERPPTALLRVLAREMGTRKGSTVGAPLCSSSAGRGLGQSRPQHENHSGSLTCSIWTLSGKCLPHARSCLPHNCHQTSLRASLLFTFIMGARISSGPLWETTQGKAKRTEPFSPPLPPVLWGREGHRRSSLK